MSEIELVVIGKLQAALDSRRLCILTGAGVSTQVAGLPGWSGLLNKALEFAEQSNNVDDVDAGLIRGLLPRWPLFAGSMLREVLTKPSSHLFSDWLESKFGHVNYDANVPLLQVLADIRRAYPFVRFATTNYDMVVDKHLHLHPLNWNETEDMNDFFGVGVGEQSRLLHLHGTYKKAATVVFSADDYARLGGRHFNQPDRDPLQRLLDNYTVLFIGCGGTTTDPHFTAVYQRLNSEGPADHILLYRRASGDNSPPPNPPRTFAFAHGDYNDLAATVRKLVPGLGISIPPSRPSPERPLLGVPFSRPAYTGFLKLGFEIMRLVVDAANTDLSHEDLLRRDDAILRSQYMPLFEQSTTALALGDRQTRFDEAQNLERQLYQTLSIRVGPEAAGFARIGAITLLLSLERAARDRGNDRSADADHARRMAESRVSEILEFAVNRNRLMTILSNPDIKEIADVLNVLEENASGA